MEEELAALAATEEKRERKVAAAMPRVPLHPLALVSLGFVLLTRWHWIFAVGAVGFAVLALVDIRRTAKHYGKALAVIGLVLGLVVGVVSFYLRYAPEQLLGRTVSKQCMQNLRIVYGALDSYAAAHGARYPRNLEEVTYLCARERLNCPGCSHRGRADCTYLFLGAGRRHDPGRS